MNEREADIRTGFAHLRNLCDERGHDLLRVFEEILLEEDRGFASIRQAVEDTEGWVALRESPILTTTSNGHHSRRVDLWRADA